MRTRAALVLALAALPACGHARPALAPVPGETVSYVQRFALSDRTSDGDELPSVAIEQQVDVTCTSVEGDRLTLSLGYGDVAVWIGEVGDEPDFAARSHDAAERAFDEAEADLAAMYAALWATNAHVDVLARVDATGAVHGVEGGRETARHDRGDAPSGDLGGALLESLIDDPTLLWAATDATGRRPLRFALDQWGTAFTVSAVQTLRADGAFEIAYASADDAAGGGPFERLDLRVEGAGVRDTETGLLVSATLRMEVDATVPGEGGAARVDTATLTYTLRRAGD